MSFGVFTAVLAAAFLHALWNALIKFGSSKIGGMMILSILGIGIGALVVALAPAIDSAAVPWVIAAGFTHFAYKFFLGYAYEHGDLSRVYPIARGAAPMLVTIVGLMFLADQVSGSEYFGIAVLAFGILLMARGVFSSGESRRLLPYALGSALATACYTLIDGQGARVSGSAWAYVGWVFIADGLIFTSGMVLWRGTAILPRDWQLWKLGTVATAASYSAYAISINAMMHAPIAVVAALRETSILFAVLIGWLAFGERMGREKAVAALVIVAGVILTRL